MNYQHEFISAIAEALENRDIELLEKAWSEASQWLGSTGEKIANEYLYFTALEAIDTITSYESGE